MAWMETERKALVATLRANDPGAPTLCEGWDVTHLLGHLVLRENSLPQAAFDMIARRPPGREVFLGRTVAKAGDDTGYHRLVNKFAGGPSRYNPIGRIGDAANLVEYVIHHEDIRRAGDSPAAPRELPADEVAAIWKRSSMITNPSFRSSPVGVTLVAPGFGRRVAKAGPGVVITGAPVELVLYSGGRREVARVEITGSESDLQAFATWAA